VQKFILASILFAHVALPLWAARDRSPRRGLKKVLLSMLVFNAVYLVALLFVFPRV
jgi:hypothetical protein